MPRWWRCAGPDGPHAAGLVCPGSAAMRKVSSRHDRKSQGDKAQPMPERLQDACSHPPETRSVKRNGKVPLVSSRGVNTVAMICSAHVYDRTAACRREATAHMRQDKHGYPLITQRYAAIGMPSCLLVSQQ